MNKKTPLTSIQTPRSTQANAKIFMSDVTWDIEAQDQALSSQDITQENLHAYMTHLHLQQTMRGEKSYQVELLQLFEKLAQEPNPVQQKAVIGNTASLVSLWQKIVQKIAGKTWQSGESLQNMGGVLSSGAALLIALGLGAAYYLSPSAAPTLSMNEMDDYVHMHQQQAYHHQGLLQFIGAP